MDFKKIEKIAQKLWADQGIFKYRTNPKSKKFYVLDMFPYPSGNGLHVGHIKGYTATDIVSHYMRLNGFNVLHPMGWDAFGLPAENYAIKMKVNPKTAVAKNIARFKKQMQSLGFSYDWSREINTTDPNYYKWTQWVFLQMYKKGLAYQDNIPINFCPSCKTGLANEEVVAGKCERCSTTVVKKQIRQWVLKITEYADRLLKDLDDLDWPDPIKEMQRNWIGRSEGSDIEFKLRGAEESVRVFTTRIDTLFGSTYLVLSPEYKDIKNITKNANNKDEITQYIKEASEKTDIERSNADREKTGVKVEGVKAVNPINNEEIEVWVADYVLGNYGTGAVMAVPGHDDRDFDFAKKYNIDIKYVVLPKSTELVSEGVAHTDYGYLVNSGKYTGMSSQDAIKKMTRDLSKDSRGNFAVNYKLRDWIFSRQRYWGEPIPIIHCKECGTVPVKEDELPVELPDINSYEPAGNGESPLAKVSEWVDTKCPKCGGGAKRETDTMPQWAGSSWYYLRYIDTDNSRDLVALDKERTSMPVDLYVGGAEHAVLHLLYARFWHKFLYDNKKVSTSEPFSKLRNVGTIIAPDGQKMSKSRGNVINPDDIINQYGVDALRMYEMFIGPFEKQATWSDGGVTGSYNFIKKIVDSFKGRSKMQKSRLPEIALLSKTVSKKIEKMNLNTIVSDMMKFVNNLDLTEFDDASWKKFLVCLSPICPHTAEYLWIKLGGAGSVFEQRWDNSGALTERMVNIIVQVNGKKKDLLNLENGLSEEAVTSQAIDVLSKKSMINKSNIDDIIYIKDRVINFVTK